MHPEIHHASLDIQCADTCFFFHRLQRIARLFDSLVVAVLIIGSHLRKLHQLLKHIIIIENCGLGHLIQAVRSHAADPAVCLEHNRSHAVPFPYFTHCARITADVIIKEIFLTVIVHNRSRKVLNQILLHSRCSAGRTAAAVGRGECFVEIEEAHIKACVSCPCDAQQPVCICLVVSAKTADGMDIIHKFFHMAVINAGILRICHNITCRFRSRRSFELL